MDKRIFSKLFQDKTGRYIVAQPPNVPLFMVIVSYVLHIFLDGTRLGGIAEFTMSSSIFLWAYLEIMFGASLFRRIIGGVIMVVLLFSQLVK